MQRRNFRSLLVQVAELVSQASLPSWRIMYMQSRHRNGTVVSKVLESPWARALEPIGSLCFCSLGPLSIRAHHTQPDVAPMAADAALGVEEAGRCRNMTPLLPTPLGRAREPESRNPKATVRLHKTT